MGKNRETARNTFGGVVDRKVICAIENTIGKTIHDGWLDAEAKIDFAFEHQGQMVCVQVKFGGGRSCHFPNLELAAQHRLLQGRKLVGVLLSIVGWVNPTDVFDGGRLLLIIKDAVRNGDEVVYFSPSKNSVERRMSFSQFRANWEYNNYRSKCTR